LLNSISRIALAYVISSNSTVYY